MKERWQGFSERVKRLNPLWQLGGGMNLGELNPYARMLGLALLLEVFFRELDNNPARTRQDLLQITQDLLQEMHLHVPDVQIIRRFVDGILWSGTPQMQESFTAYFFDEKEERMAEQSFRYLQEDRLNSQWERGGNTVYQLTDESLELIFMSREVLQELEIGIDQLYVQQQIKRGNYRKALRGLDDLLAKVNRLIQQEQGYQADMKRNPKIIFQQGGRWRSKREEEIHAQFAEEKKRFDELQRALHRMQETDSGEWYALQDKLERTRVQHDKLAQVVLDNIALEVELRVRYPQLFWNRPSYSFRRNVWEEGILKEGLAHPDQLSLFLEPLFSPEPPFLFPLDWGWAEQTESVWEEEERVEETSAEIEAYVPHRIDFEQIADVWQPIFLKLLEEGHFSLSELAHIGPEEQQKWLLQKETSDLWLMFFASPLVVPPLTPEMAVTDDRLKLIQVLQNRDSRFLALTGKRIRVQIEPGKPMIRWEKLAITPFYMIVEEEGSPSD
ncbi:conserved hypothetical protein [[Clostridium] ultunense Esp]|nr:conserved hypothetical protein [[Clostridium] ultunense Esp]